MICCTIWQYTTVSEAAGYDKLLNKRNSETIHKPKAQVSIFEYFIILLLTDTGILIDQLN